MAEEETKIYIFLGKSKYSHISLDSEKSAHDKETIELNAEDQKKTLIKKLIKAGKDKNEKEDRLVPAKEIDEVLEPTEEEVKEPNDNN